MKIPRIPFVIATAVITTSAWAENMIIQTNATVICRSNLVVTSGKITVENGGSLIISNGTVTCQDFQLDADAALTASTGTLQVSQFWINDSDFVKPASLDMPKAISSPSETNFAIGVGDTDQDGVSDRGEGSFDANSNEIADFLDPAQSAPSAYIPIEWLLANGFPTNHVLDYEDSDGDGASNWQEYHAMTGPWDSNSVLAITEFIQNMPSTGDVTITWNSVDGRTYELQYGTNLTETGMGFFAEVPNVDGQAGSTTVIIPEATDSQGFYRIKVHP